MAQSKRNPRSSAVGNELPTRRAGHERIRRERAPALVLEHRFLARVSVVAGFEAAELGRLERIGQEQGHFR